MNDQIPIYLGRDDAELSAQVRACSPRFEIVGDADLERDSDLAARLQIAYGTPPRPHFEAATALRWVQTMGAGVNDLLPKLDARERPELIVTNVSGIHAEPITEQMFGMLFQVTRCLKEAAEQQKTRQWDGFDFGANVDMICGKTLGLLGVGAIGTHAAKVGKAFGMKVVGLRRGDATHPEIEELFTPESRLDFFRRCDVVMNTLPFTEKTRDFMGRAEFEALPEGAIVINTGRGGTIDTDAMMNALQSGRLKAALLDVTQPEPLPPEHSLWTTAGVFITPHFSGVHPQYNARADAIFLDNLKLFLAKKPLHHVVDQEEGY